MSRPALVSLKNLTDNVEGEEPKAVIIEGG